MKNRLHIVFFLFFSVGSVAAESLSTVNSVIVFGDRVFISLLDEDSQTGISQSRVFVWQESKKIKALKLASKRAISRVLKTDQGLFLLQSGVEESSQSLLLSVVNPQTLKVQKLGSVTCEVFQKLEVKGDKVAVQCSDLSEEKKTSASLSFKESMNAKIAPKKPQWRYQVLGDLRDQIVISHLKSRRRHKIDVKKLNP